VNQAFGRVISDGVGKTPGTHGPGLEQSRVVQEPATPGRMFLAAHLPQPSAPLPCGVYSGQRVRLTVHPGESPTVLVPVLMLWLDFEELEKPSYDTLIGVYVFKLTAFYFYPPPSVIQGLFVVTRGVTREITRVVTRVMWDKHSSKNCVEVEPELEIVRSTRIRFRGR
jgi:hypothetical protein